MNRYVVPIASLLFITLSVIPQFAAAADGGNKTFTVRDDKDAKALTTTSAPVIPATPDAAAVCKKAEADLLQCRADLAKCQEGQKDIEKLKKFVEAGCKGENPLKPKKPKASKATTVVEDTLICVAPATKVKVGRKQYCACPEGGTPARLVDKDSAAFDRHVVKGECVTPYEIFRNRIADLEDQIKRLKPAEREAPSKDLTALLLWYQSLINSKTSLTAENWEDLNDRVDDLEGRVDALEKRMGDAEARIGVVEKKVKELAPVGVPVEFSLALRFDYAFRLGVATEGFSGAAQAAVTKWVTATDAVSFVGMLGLAAPSDGHQRYLAGGGIYGQHAFKENRSLSLRGGLIALAEPPLKGLNQGLSFMGDLGLEFRPGGGCFAIQGGVLIGASRVALFTSNTSWRTSDWGVRFDPYIGGGFVF